LGHCDRGVCVNDYGQFGSIAKAMAVGGMQRGLPAPGIPGAHWAPAVDA